MLLKAADGLFTPLLGMGTLFMLIEAAGFEGVSPGIALTRGYGPVSSGPDAGIALPLVREMASGSGSSVIDTPFPFFFIISSIMSSQLTELLVWLALFLELSSPAEGVTELIGQS